MEEFSLLISDTVEKLLSGKSQGYPDIPIQKPQPKLAGTRCHSLAVHGANITLIQELFTYRNRILGLGAMDFILCKADTAKSERAKRRDTGKRRACILTKKNLQIILLSATTTI